MQSAFKRPAPNTCNPGPAPRVLPEWESVKAEDKTLVYQVQAQIPDYTHVLNTRNQAFALAAPARCLPLSTLETHASFQPCSLQGWKMPMQLTKVSGNGPNCSDCSVLMLVLVHLQPFSFLLLACLEHCNIAAICRDRRLHCDVCWL